MHDGRRFRGARGRPHAHTSARYTHILVSSFRRGCRRPGIRQTGIFRVDDGFMVRVYCRVPPAQCDIFCTYRVGSCVLSVIPVTTICEYFLAHPVYMMQLYLYSMYRYGVRYLSNLKFSAVPVGCRRYNNIIQFVPPMWTRPIGHVPAAPGPSPKNTIAKIKNTHANNINSDGQPRIASLFVAGHLPPPNISTLPTKSPRPFNRSSSTRVLHAYTDPPQKPPNHAGPGLFFW